MRGKGVLIFNRSQLHNAVALPDKYGKIVFKNKGSVEGGVVSDILNMTWSNIACESEYELLRGYGK